MSNWQRLCATSELSADEMFAATLGGIELIAVLDQNGAAKVYKDLCSHQDVRLSDFGEITADRELICHAHAARFCLSDGRALCQPATAAITAFPCKIEGGELWVQLP